MESSIDKQVLELIETAVSVQIEKYYSELIIQNKKYLNKKEACLYLGISYVTAEKYIFNELPYLKFGKTIKYDREDIDRWVDDNMLFDI
ncbi:helix-turn-helix domain-containing protein [Jeotgalibaca caeni]|uniref:helix-turn-helix domain-containing protein n=1 Tax=Jeotgalibaca caeni TaxID=3028623 RepID=UPI00237DF9E7|nr:helix-turn-helix domain-containing protein [Jeotgalibaca caeni]MDE1548140.1 helix-turn-helix domain-containing protein [Jeotgalibaca caeni]